MISYILILIISYLCGAVPFSYLLVKWVKGVDIRDVGSGNVGATNAGRVLGKWGFITAFLMDMSKAFIPLFTFLNYLSINNTLILISAVCIIIGHTYTVFLRFKGGKGVATGVGIFLALSPFNLFIALLVFLIVIGIFRMVSLGSVTAAISLAVLVWLRTDWLGLQLFTTLVVLFIIFKHRSNIRRIIEGKESKIGEKVG
ncbi:MAG: glycerol-3-phosphate 1-O-acyltransferase PlsY [Flexistipes sinusarabici]|uniref:Glycerol-3-phosphate acyltransferase n=1 Tax=Flexistipes sinusarabici TaxID=2352 RepID=A0A5D0MPN7_FLESI|nr:glycerol-3-phosphate 1-O-acyltransferase PlsY [Flexistipes sinusarabici]TYB33500.1 MAG: glycerol-3-phosphate 1-O-acyltransferase PlsY [Flexistipes sinusarabici]